MPVSTKNFVLLDIVFLSIDLCLCNSDLIILIIFPGWVGLPKRFLQKLLMANFKCIHCQKVFSKNSLMKRHLESVHEGLKAKCNKCDKEYSCKDHLKRHGTSVH